MTSRARRRAFYETDFYAGIGGAAGPVGLDVTYTAYMSPRGSWGTVKELALGFSVDNVAAPYATIAFEMSGNAAGDSGGTYFELGIEPSAPLDDAPVSLSFPIAIGMSPSNYYNPGGVNYAFGFFSAGASIGIPLAVPAQLRRVGNWARRQRTGVRRRTQADQRGRQRDEDHRPVRSEPRLLAVCAARHWDSAFLLGGGRQRQESEERQPPAPASCRVRLIKYAGCGVAEAHGRRVAPVIEVPGRLRGRRFARQLARTSMPHTDHGPSPSAVGSPGALSDLSGRLAKAREELSAEAVRARAGVRTLRRYSSRIDGILKDIHGAARELTDKPTALIPLGGYGRRHLCQYSDIDLLIVVDGAIGAPEERFLRAILHPLWDLGLEVGHQVRQFSEFAEPETDNPEYLAALLDSRFLVGDREVFDRFTEACLTAESPWRAPMRAALIDLARQRHGQFNHTVFQLEPDIKDAPGGLRDATAIRLLARMASGAPGQPYMDVGRVDEAEDFMLRVRSILHMERGHNLNVLAHGLQETVAQHFGSPGDEKRRQVELLMSTYYHHARRIDRSMATVLKSSQAPPDRHQTVKPIGNDLECAWDGIRFVDGTLASLQPHSWLRPFEAALEEDVDVSEQVLTCIERHGERYTPESFFPAAEERDRLLRVLRPRPGLYDRLSDMHGRGLLGRMFPEFQKVYCLVVRDFYHKYTVDEHTLRTIRAVEALCAPRTASRKRFAAVLRELEQPELLVLALLFHDVGKWTNKNHSEEGVRMAIGALRRIRLPEKAIATVEFLIRHHLQMSVLAFRRDVEDPKTATQFARLVGTEERLKLLCLLTLADVDAVSPGVMTPWKEEMLWRLYVDTYNRLTLGYSDDAIDDAGAVRNELSAQRPPDVSQADLDTFIEGLPRRYLRIVDRPRVYEHVRLTRGLQPREVRSLLEQKDAAWELSTIRAGPARPVREGVRRPVVLRHGHPAGPGDDQPARPRPGHLPVRRPGRLSAAEPGGARRAHGAARGRDRRTGGHRRQAAGALGVAVDQPLPATRHADRALQQPLFPAFHGPRSGDPERLGPALSSQPRPVRPRLRHRPRPDLDRGRAGHRRLSHHEGPREAVGRRPGDAEGRVAAGPRHELVTCVHISP